MSRGKSGRIVLEVEPALKDELYTMLAKRNLTLKQWFIQQSQVYVQNADQGELFVVEPSSEDYHS